MSINEQALVNTDPFVGTADGDVDASDLGKPYETDGGGNTSLLKGKVPRSSWIVSKGS